ncbi:TetR/AcrR family transcriptional regulator [Nonomuraea sp. NPDC059007]|uniref:TetR/AcrR family transcriptional regulator n=1 Tax=Nonomuraea sp. NPDC059007 TaxID=3346692 RepID=UPI0036C3C221
MQEQSPSVWTRQPKKSPALTRELIVATAIRVLDAEGLEALSMRRLGAELGTAATAFYRHVASKDELIELVVDQIYAEIEIPESGDPADWRTPTLACAHSLRAAILRHPWSAQLFGAAGLSYLGPNTMETTDRMIGILETAGFPLEAANRALSTVASYVTGVTMAEAAALSLMSRNGVSQEDWVALMWPVAERAAQPYPRLRRLYAAQHATDVSVDAAREDQFSFGLRHILDGLESERTTG